MLLDKSGLRKRDGSEKETKRKPGKAGGFKQMKNKPSPEEMHNRAVQMALMYGIGYDEYKHEVDSIRAAQIREKLEQAHKK